MSESRSLPAFHLRLRRIRRLRALKQSVVAELVGVDQSTVSRWEAGALVPGRDLAEQILRTLGGVPANDDALCRLVRTSTLPVHLVTDTDHRLLAMSPARRQQWGDMANQIVGVSLWRYASPEIKDAEHQLVRSRWWAEASPAPVIVTTRACRRDGLRFVTGEMLWERVWLASGEPARLCTTLTGRGG